jgi:cytochrome aa3-600 menaquinol oxidase subunit 2
VSKFKSLLLLFGSLILLSGCSNVEVLNPKGPMASDSKFLIIYSIIFMLVIIAAVLIMFALFLVKYRLGNNKESGKMHHNSLIEVNMVYCSSYNCCCLSNTYGQIIVPI